jgi:hypothetical protein
MSRYSVFEFSNPLSFHNVCHVVSYDFNLALFFSSAPAEGEGRKDSTLAAFATKRESFERRLGAGHYRSKRCYSQER